MKPNRIEAEQILAGQPLGNLVGTLWRYFPSIGISKAEKTTLNVDAFTRKNVQLT
jgi:hypothetical protein